MPNTSLFHFHQLPEKKVYGAWPNSGEIDVMETVGIEPYKFWGTTHTASNFGKNANTYAIALNKDDWHTFEINWEPDRVQFAADGEIYYEYSRTGTSSVWPFDQDFHIVMNIAVGGDWGGIPDDSAFMGNGQIMEIDWVRVYASGLSPPSPPPPTPTVPTPPPSPTSANNIQIQAENYLYMQGVQIEDTSDVNGGKNVGYIDTGDWMSYQVVTIPSTGAYRVEYRVASVGSGGSLRLEKAGGTQVYGIVSIPNTGGWQTWQTVSHTVNLNAGPIEFGIKAIGGGWNINWFRITLASSPITTEPTTHQPSSKPTTRKPTTTSKPTTRRPSFRPTRRPTNEPTTYAPTSVEPTTNEPTTNEPTTNTNEPSTNEPTTNEPTTNEPTTRNPTSKPTTRKPTTRKPTTRKPTTPTSTSKPSTRGPTSGPSSRPTVAPMTHSPTSKPVSVAPYWLGPIRLINRIPKTTECIYMDKPVNWFAPGNRQGSLYENQQVELGPFSGWYTLGVQENTFGACSYIGAIGHRCYFDNGRVDNFCFNFNVDGNCRVKQNVCPYPAPSNGYAYSPAPDGATRYSIEGVVKGGVCELTVQLLANPGPITPGCRNAL